MNYLKRIKLPQHGGEIEVSVENTKHHGGLVYLELTVEGCYDYNFANLTPEQAYQLSHELSIAATLATMNKEEKTMKQNDSRKNQSIPIIATNIKTGESQEFYGVRECARQVQIDHSSIIQVLKGKRKQAGGYSFQYKEEK